MPALRDKLRAICHSLRMGSYESIESYDLDKIKKCIKDLPSPEQISRMKHEDLKSLQTMVNDIIDKIDNASPVRGIGSAIRHHIDKNLPPFRAPVLGNSTNWYKTASEDYSKRLSPLWNVVKLSGEEFRLQYDKYPILDFVLTKRSEEDYNGGIKETKLHGGKFMSKVPRDVRPPMIIEIFSKAKDILTRDIDDSKVAEINK